MIRDYDRNETELRDLRTTVDILDGGLRRFATGDIRTTLEQPFPLRLEGIRRDFNRGVSAVSRAIDSVLGNAQRLRTDADLLRETLAENADAKASRTEKVAQLNIDAAASDRATKQQAAMTHHVAAIAHNTRLDMRRPKEAVAAALKMIESIEAANNEAAWPAKMADLKAKAEEIGRELDAMGISAFLVSVAGLSAMPAFAQQAAPPASQCQAIAKRLPNATFASFSASELPVVRAKSSVAAPEMGEVKITFVGHSTYFIETPGGVGIATDYSGVYRPPRLPDVVTMNKAHSTHYTFTPDPNIPHVLHGWSDVPGEKAEHHLTVGDVYIRNVVSDIRNWGGNIEENGNSIFVFEVAGLCIGHLGHLHFELNEKQYAEIGRLDVVMVPVDGGLTMGADSMSRVVQRLRSSLILPMHRWGPPLDTFLSMFNGKFDVAYAKDTVITVSLRTLPKKPTILVPQGL